MIRTIRTFDKAFVFKITEQTLNCGNTGAEMDFGETARRWLKPFETQQTHDCRSEKLEIGERQPIRQRTFEMRRSRMGNDISINLREPPQKNRSLNSPRGPYRTTALLLPFLLALHSAPAAASKAAPTEDQIRRIVASLLEEKDKKIAQLEARISQLEGSREHSEAKPEPKLAAVGSAKPATPDTQSIREAVQQHHAITHTLLDLGAKVEELKHAAEDEGLDISGFFDVNAKTDNATDQTFSVGSVELDLEYSYDENYAASSALVLCGNSSGIDPVNFPSAPVGVSCGGSGPGGIGAGPAGFAVAFVDFHMFDHSIPPRGRIFNNQGFHIQAGRFDLPFSSDYQNYANKDRVTVTAPITTTRMQFGGFNGDGVRSYGSWKNINYSIFWTDAMYGNDGTSLGGRLGFTVGQNIFRSHHGNPEGIEFGFSHLTDLDGDRNVRNRVYGVDFSFGYGILKLQSELMWLRAQNDLLLDLNGAGKSTNLGKPNELGYHVTLVGDLDKYLGHPLSAFVRYGRWDPKHRAGMDFDGSVVALNDISLLTVGVNYKFNDYMRFKLEYTDSLGTMIGERYFDNSLGIAQMVLAF